MVLRWFAYVCGLRSVRSMVSLRAEAILTAALATHKLSAARACLLTASLREIPIPPRAVCAARAIGYASAMSDRTLARSRIRGQMLFPLLFTTAAGIALLAVGATTPEK